MIQHYDYPFVKSVVVCGDIHAEIDGIRYTMLGIMEMKELR